MNKLEKSVIDAKFDNYDFDKIVAKFTWDETFYSYFFQDMEKIKTTKYPTAAATVRDGEPIILYNEKYFNSLSWRHKFGLFQHEILHLVFQHTTSRIRLKPNGQVDKLWFWCADFAINSLIEPKYIHDNWLLPGRWPKLTEKEKEQYTEEEIGYLQDLREEILQWPLGESSDWYYKMMKDNPGAKKGFEIVHENSSNNIADSHDLWGNSSENSKVIEENIRRKLVEAIKESEKTKWGSVSAPFQSMLKQMTSEKIDWKSLLRNFTGKCQSTEQMSTIKKINRRYPYVHPGRKKRRTSSIVVCIDQSGSMSDESLILLFAELSKLSEFTEFVVVPFDSKVVEDKIFTWEKDQKIMPERVAHGGTNFSIPTKWVNKNSARFDAAIFLTDGYCSKPIACKIPRAWIIIPGGRLTFETQELVIPMSEDDS